MSDFIKDFKTKACNCFGIIAVVYAKMFGPDR